MNPYEEKQERRRERLEEAAERAADRAGDRFRAADRATAGIPFGQPILVGHHSERRHRRALERQEQAVRRGVEEAKLAKDLQRRAEAVGSGGVSSDDPDAIDKLRAKIADLEAVRDARKAFNAAWRKAGKPSPPELDGSEAGAAAWAAFESCLREDLRALLPAAAGGLRHDGRRSDGVWRLHSWAKPFGTSHANAKIRDAKRRIGELEALGKARPEEVYSGDGWVIRTDPGQNRVLVEFSGKPPADARALVKAAGFNWSRGRGAWVRKLTGGWRGSAFMLAKGLREAKL